MHISQSAEDAPAGSPGARSHVWIAVCSSCIPQPLPQVTLVQTAKRHRGNKAECLHLCATQGEKRHRESKPDAPKDLHCRLSSSRLSSLPSFQCSPRCIPTDTWHPHCPAEAFGAVQSKPKHCFPSNNQLLDN